MKILSLVAAVFIFCGVNLFPQSGKTSHTYSISGVVIDSITQEKIPGVTIIVLAGDNAKNPKGALSGSKGEFTIEDLSSAHPKLRLSIIGYKTKLIDSIAIGNQSKINLGTIKMQAGTVQMGAVEIKAARPMVEYRADKQVINMESVPGASGNVSDALRNTGIVDVDPQSNKISLRGKSGVNIQIDGKPLPNAEDLLTQMPASMIDQVEITTNPSAKDDPEGDAGIINFITKKGYSDNYSGSLTLYMNNKHMNYASAFVNLKKGNLNLYGSLNGGKGNFSNELDYDRTNYNSLSIHRIHSTGDGLRKGFMLNGKLGADYDYDSLNSFSISASYFKMKGSGHNNSFNEIYNNADTYIYNYFQLNNGELDNNTYSETATYKKKYDKKGNELVSDIYYSYLTYDTPNDLVTNYNYNSLAKTIHQNSTSLTKNKTLIAKLEWADPSWTLGKIDAGYNYTYRDRSTDYNFNDYIDSLQLWQQDANFSNYFQYKENIHAVYTNFGNKFWILDYRLGLRLEKILSKGTVVTTNQDFELNYSSVFPSLLLSYSISDRFQITFNAARRIRRPQMEYINPFRRINGPNDYTIGNPALQPTYTNLFELAFNPLLKVYYTQSSGRPVSITAIVQDTAYTSMVNNATTNTFGFEVMIPIINDSKFPIELPSWFSMGNIAFTYSKIDESSSYLSESYNTSRKAWNLNANVVLKVIYDINAILSLRYTPEIKDTRTVTNQKTFLSFTVAKEFMDKKLRVAIIASDMLNASMSETETFGTNYYLNNRFTNLNSQNISLAITYKFNDFKARQERQIDDGRDKTEGGLF